MFVFVFVIACLFRNLIIYIVYRGGQRAVQRAEQFEMGWDAPCMFEFHPHISSAHAKNIPQCDLKLKSAER